MISMVTSPSIQGLKSFFSELPLVVTFILKVRTLAIFFNFFKILFYNFKRFYKNHEYSCKMQQIVQVFCAITL